MEHETARVKQQRPHFAASRHLVDASPVPLQVLVNGRPRSRGFRSISAYVLQAREGMQVLFRKAQPAAGSVRLGFFVLSTAGCWAAPGMVEW